MPSRILASTVNSTTTKAGGACRQELHHQRTAQGAHDHDALQADVDDAGVFREAAAQRHQQQDGGENQRVLQQQ